MLVYSICLTGEKLQVADLQQGPFLAFLLARECRLGWMKIFCTKAQPHQLHSTAPFSLRVTIITSISSTAHSQQTKIRVQNGTHTQRAVQPLLSPSSGLILPCCVVDIHHPVQNANDFPFPPGLNRGPTLLLSPFPRFLQETANSLMQFV